MGSRGPIGNRSDDLARPRSRKGSEEQDVKAGTMKPVTIPEADPEWHAIAKMVWDSLIESGQSDFYQQSDWAFAYSLCEELDMYKQPRIYKETGETYYKRSPEMFKALLSAMSSLMMTEGDRRRVRVELSQPEEATTSPALALMSDYRAGLGVTPEDNPEQPA